MSKPQCRKDLIVNACNLTIRTIFTMRYPGFNQSSAAQRCLLNTLRLIAVTLGLAWPAIVFAGTLDDIRESGEITLAYRADTPPFSSRGKDKQPEGFTIDLCNNIVADIKAQLDLDELKVNWIEVSSGERIDAISSLSEMLFWWCR